MKILIASDDLNISDQIQSRLVFLRREDCVIQSDYSEAQEKIETRNIDIVLICENTTKQKTLNFIKKLRKNRNIAIVLVPNSYDEKFILKAYDVFIDDFIILNSPDFEYVVRIINSYNKISSGHIISQNLNILEKAGIADENTHVYEKKYAKDIICHHIDTYSVHKGSYMVISPVSESISHFSALQLADAIRNSMRSNDIHVLGKGVRQCVFLPEADMNGALILFNRIKQELKFEICAGIADIDDKSFEEFERDAVSALMNCLASKAEYVFYEDTKDEIRDYWLNNTKTQNYKIFKQVFDKKLKNVIEPVFYRMQQIYDGKLNDTKIEQIVNEDACFFKLKNDDSESILKIIYPGFSKIILYTNHPGLDSAENQEIHLPLSDINDKSLTEIIEAFIKEYQS